MRLLRHLHEAAQRAVEEVREHEGVAAEAVLRLEAALRDVAHVRLERRAALLVGQPRD